MPEQEIFTRSEMSLVSLQLVSVRKASGWRPVHPHDSIVVVDSAVEPPQLPRALLDNGSASIGKVYRLQAKMRGKIIFLIGQDVKLS